MPGKADLSRRPPALRLRLLIASAASISLALVVAGLAITALFSAHVERTLQVDLTNQVNRLIALVDSSGEQPGLSQPLADPRFNTPFGGLYWQIEDPETGALSTSRSLWDSTLSLPDPTSAATGLQFIRITAPDGRPALAAMRRLTFDTTPGRQRRLDLAVAEDLGSVEQAKADFGYELARDLSLLAVALILAAWIQVSLGLKPLNTIRRGLEAIRSGKSRSLVGNYPAEVMPLVAEVNELLRTQEISIGFARDRAADLAHGLKTSLTVLTAEAEQLRQAGNPESASAIEQLAEDMARTIDHQLSLSRLRFRSRADHYVTDIGKLTAKIANTLAKTPKGRDLHWQRNVASGLAVDLDPSDLTELLGIVLDNATQYAASTIRLTATGESEMVRLEVEEDGPGLSAKQMAMVGERGRRLDQTKSGTGIGLAIAREIVAMNGGSMDFSASALGGLKVTLRLPAADRQLHADGA